jgi:hypothetical protein
MGNYYIKKHYNTGGEYPGPEGVHFTARASRAAEKFAACRGFLLYEAGSAEKTGLPGSKRVYGYGHILAGPEKLAVPREVRGKEYHYLVRVRVERTLKNKLRGVPLVVLREQYGVSLRPSLGGIEEISEAAFGEIKRQLDAAWEEEKP